MAKTLRTPGQVFDDLQTLKVALPKLLLEYRRAHDFAHSAGGGAGGESGRAGDIAYSDSTGDVALSKMGSRAKVRRVGESIADMVSMVNADLAMLHKAYPKDSDAYQEVLRMPPMITNAEKAEAHAAQARREARGDL